MGNDKPNWNRWDFLLYVCILLLPAVVQIGCSTKPEPDGKVAVRGVKQFEETARAIAKNWEVDSFLSSVHVDALSSTQTAVGPMADLLEYEFRSARHTQESLAITFLMDGTPKVDKLFAVPQGSWVPIEPDEWKVDSTDVWDIAQKEFQLKHKGPIFDRVVIQLERTNPPRTGSLLWYVADASDSSIRIWIFPKTGQLVDKIPR